MGENSDNFLSCNSHWSNWDSLYTLSEDDEEELSTIFFWKGQVDKKSLF